MPVSSSQLPAKSPSRQNHGTKRRVLEISATSYGRIVVPPQTSRHLSRPIAPQRFAQDDLSLTELRELRGKQRTSYSRLRAGWPLQFPCKAPGQSASNEGG